MADKFLTSCFDLRFRPVFYINETVSRSLHRSNELIKLYMHCLGIPVLSVLNQKHHEKCDDCRAGVDDKLPRIGKAEDWSAHCPDDDDPEGEDEGSGSANDPGDPRGKRCK